MWRTVLRKVLLTLRCPEWLVQPPVGKRSRWLVWWVSTEYQPLVSSPPQTNSVIKTGRYNTSQYFNILLLHTWNDIILFLCVQKSSFCPPPNLHETHFILTYVRSWLPWHMSSLWPWHVGGPDYNDMWLLFCLDMYKVLITLTCDFPFALTCMRSWLPWHRSSLLPWHLWGPDYPDMWLPFCLDIWDSFAWTHNVPIT